jgi:hypothetical protein
LENVRSGGRSAVRPARRSAAMRRRRPSSSCGNRLAADSISCREESIPTQTDGQASIGNGHISESCKSERSGGEGASTPQQPSRAR